MAAASAAVVVAAVVAVEVAVVVAAVMAVTTTRMSRVDPRRLALPGPPRRRPLRWLPSHVMCSPASRSPRLRCLTGQRLSRDGGAYYHSLGDTPRHPPRRGTGGGLRRRRGRQPGRPSRGGVGGGRNRMHHVGAGLWRVSRAGMVWRGGRGGGRGGGPAVVRSAMAAAGGAVGDEAPAAASHPDWRRQGRGRRRAPTGLVTKNGRGGGVSRQQ